MNAPSLITDEIRAQIVAEPDSVSYQAISDKYGVTWYHVKNIRMKAGVHNQDAATARNSATSRNGNPKMMPEFKPEIARLGDRTNFEPSVKIAAETHYDRAIQDVEEQIALFQSALTVLQGLRDLALAERSST